MILNFSLFFNSKKRYRHKFSKIRNSSNEPKCTTLTFYKQKKKALHSGVPFSF